MGTLFFTGFLSTLPWTNMSILRCWRMFCGLLWGPCLLTVFTGSSRMGPQPTALTWSWIGWGASLERESFRGMQTIPGLPGALTYLPWTTGCGLCVWEILERSPPAQDTVDEFVHNLDRRMVIKSARDIQVRAKACKEAKGGAFEFRLKKFKKNINNEE